MIILNAQQMRDAEIAMTNRSVSLLQLMENAGTAAAERIMQNEDVCGKKIAVVCGKGNNGGDGYVIARVLHEKGADVKVILCMGSPSTGDAKHMYSKMDHINRIDYALDASVCFGAMDSADIIIDCIFGIGFKGHPRKPVDEIIEHINRSPAKVYAIDLPSGQDCDTGYLSDCTVKADCTITFTTLKPCHTIYPSKQNCGTVTVENVGIHEDICRSLCTMETIEIGYVMSKLPKRYANSNKGSYGRLLSVCGSRNMPGACLLAAGAAMRCGTGLVQCALPECNLPIAAANIREAIFLPVKCNDEGRMRADARRDILEKANRPTACLIGCGMGLDGDVIRLVYDLIQNADVPIILDADGINAAAKNKNILKEKSGGIAITPHPGEMARLCGTTADNIQQRRLEYAVGFAREYGIVVALKGANTIVTDGCRTFINTTGNAGMAKAGSGDVLSGMAGGLLAQGLSLLDAVACAVHLHGLAGDYAARKFSRISMQPGDMIEMLSAVFCDFNENT